MGLDIIAEALLMHTTDENGTSAVGEAGHL